MAGIYPNDEWAVGQAEVDGLPIIVRSRTSLPAAPDREIYHCLIMVSWPYEPENSGMPPADVNRQMQAFEDVLEQTLEKGEVGVQVASVTGNGAKQWRYYTYDTDEFMGVFNEALQGHAAYPVELQLFQDPEWGALAELIVDA